MGFNVLDMEVEVRAGRIKAGVVVLGFEVDSLICMAVVVLLFADEKRKCQYMNIR